MVDSGPEYKPQCCDGAWNPVYLCSISQKECEGYMCDNWDNGGFACENMSMREICRVCGKELK